MTVTLPVLTIKMECVEKRWNHKQRSFFIIKETTVLYTVGKSNLNKITMEIICHLLYSNRQNIMEKL